MKAHKLSGTMMAAILTTVSLSLGAGKQYVDNAHVIGVYCSVQYNCSAYFDKDLSVPSGTSKCATASGPDARRFQFDGNSPTGKSMLSILLTAQSTAALVFADGQGTCSVYTPVEDLNTIYIHN